MYKKLKVNRDVEETHLYCDVCGEEIPRDLACGIAKCECCEKDLCDKCVGHEGSSCGDYRVAYCKKCWDIGEGFRVDIEYMEERIESLYEEWKSKCNCNK